jgi:hypothetical protein
VIHIRGQLLRPVQGGVMAVAGRKNFERGDECFYCSDGVFPGSGLAVELFTRLFVLRWAPRADICLGTSTIKP